MAERENIEQQDLFPSDIWDSPSQESGEAPSAPLLWERSDPKWEMPNSVARAFEGLRKAYQRLDFCSASREGASPEALDKMKMNLVIRCKTFATKASSLVSDRRSEKAEEAKMLLHPKDVSISPFLQGLKIEWKGKLSRLGGWQKYNYPFYGYDIEEGLVEAIRRYCAEHPFERFTKDRPAFISITHISKGELAMRDYDNVDVSGVLNAIKVQLLIDDSPLFFDFHQRGRIGRENRVEVAVIPKCEMLEYLSDA